MAVYSGTSFADLHEIVCDDDIMTGVIQTLISFPATAGQTYWVQLAGFAGNGAGTFIIQSLLPPPNDNFSGAIAEPVGTSVAGSNRAATFESGEPASNVGRTVWYRVTPSQSEDITITVHASETLDAWLAVYAGASLSTLVEIASSEHGSRGDPEQVTIAATANQTYFIQVGGFADTYGDYRLVISSPTAPAARVGASPTVRATSTAPTKAVAAAGPPGGPLGSATLTRTPLPTPTALPTATKPPPPPSPTKYVPPTATATPLARP
jgi:hypothetical protein